MWMGTGWGGGLESSSVIGFEDFNFTYLIRYQMGLRRQNFLQNQEIFYQMGIDLRLQFASKPPLLLISSRHHFEAGVWRPPTRLSATMPDAITLGGFYKT